MNTSVAVALARCARTRTWSVDMCDNFCANMYGYTASGYRTALVHWESLAVGNKRPGDVHAPPGMLMYWGVGQGHVAISDGLGSVFSIDISGPGTVSRVPYMLITQRWGKPYLGWSPPIFQGVAWTGETMAAGVDYAWSHPSPTSLRSAGKTFACRYLSSDASKNLSRSEADALAAAGVWSVVVWESTANRALGGNAAGVADASAAASQAQACGIPSDRPVYFAVDFDATATQQTAIHAYLDGAASVLGRSRVGIYGGYYPVTRALNSGKAAWAWQTFAWSGGQWDSRAHIRQGAQVSIGGVSVDLDTGMVDDFGQWMPGKGVADVALTDADAAKVADAVWTKLLKTDGVLAAPPDSADHATNPFWTWQSHVQAQTTAARACLTAITELEGTAQEIKVALADPGGLIDQLKTALEGLRITITEGPVA